MSDQWHVGRDGEQYGPFSMEELKQQAGDGRLLLTDLLWKDGMAEWSPAARVPGIFPPKSAAPPLPPTPSNRPATPPPLGHSSPAPKIAVAVPARDASDYLVPLPAFLRKPLFPGLHNQRVWFFVGCLLTFITLLLPWVSSSVGKISSGEFGINASFDLTNPFFQGNPKAQKTVSGFEVEPDGVMILLLTLPACVLAFLDTDKTKPILAAKLMGAIVPLGLAALWCLIDMVRLGTVDESNNILGTVISIERSPGVGVFLAFLVTVITAAGGWLLVAKSEASATEDPFWNPNETAPPPA